MKKLILASIAAVALFGIAACSDTDKSTTQSVKQPETTQSAPVTPTPEATPPATDKTTTQGITPDPAPGTSDRVQKTEPMEPKPAQPAPAQ